MRLIPHDGPHARRSLRNRAGVRARRLWTGPATSPWPAGATLACRRATTFELERPSACVRALPNSHRLRAIVAER